MGTRKCQNPTSQLDIRKQIHFLLSAFLLQELVDMTNEVEKKGEIYFKVRLPQPTCHHLSILFWWRTQNHENKGNQRQSTIILPNLVGLLYAGLEEVQGGGRGGVHQAYVQGGQVIEGIVGYQMIFSVCAAQTLIPSASGLRNTRCEAACEATLLNSFIWWYL